MVEVGHGLMIQVWAGKELKIRVMVSNEKNTKANSTPPTKKSGFPETGPGPGRSQLGSLDGLRHPERQVPNHLVKKMGSVGSKHGSMIQVSGGPVTISPKHPMNFRIPKNEELKTANKFLGCCILPKKIELPTHSGY